MKLAATPRNTPGEAPHTPTAAALPDPARAARILGSITDAFLTLDADWRFTSLNAQAERLLHRERADVLGRCLWDEYPQAVGSTSEREYRRAVAEQRAVSFEAFSAPLGVWLEVRAFPSPDGLSVFFCDITERVARRERERFLEDLADRARRMTDPDEVITDALRSVGGFLGVSRCVFVDIDIEADVCTCHPDFRADETVASMAGAFPISAFGPAVVAAYGAGRAVVVDDVHADRAQVPAGNVATYDAAGIRAHVGVPVVHSSRLVSCIGAHSAATRRWAPEETALLQTVVERTWLTVEVLRQEHARRHEAEATARILGSITDAFFTLDREWRVTRLNDQAERLMTKKRGQTLGRVFWETFPHLNGTVFEREYRRAVAEGVAVSFEVFYAPLDSWLGVRAFPSPDGLSVFYQDVSARKRAEQAVRDSEGRYRLLLESTGEGVFGLDPAGRFSFVNRAAARMLGFESSQMTGRDARALIGPARADGAPRPDADCPLLGVGRGGGGARVEDGVFRRADGTPLPVAYTAAPIWEHGAGEDGAAAGAVVTFTDITERRALDAERERLARRERRIAEELQAALTPAIPTRVPGLALAKYYEAALDEAGVGGDFYDVFPVGDGRTALVVGDLSGKGLAAATQVATVRNMLRYAVYRARSLAGALEGLNALLIEQRLLTGFATLFVGAYDAGVGALTYANCGQEPALVRRAATGRVETLPATGPVLGSFVGAPFAEQTVALGPGDALAAFTDGLTEVGRSRLEMLGAEGVAALLERPLAPAEAEGAEGVSEHLAVRLIAGVDAAAQAGVTRDDMCLLVAVAV